MCFQTEKVTTVLFGFIIPVLMACLAFHTATDLSRKTGSDSFTVKHSVVGVSITAGSSEMTIIYGCPVSH